MIDHLGLGTPFIDPITSIRMTGGIELAVGVFAALGAIYHFTVLAL